MGLSIAQPVAGTATGTSMKAKLGFWYCDCFAKGDVDGNRNANPLDVTFLVNCVYKTQCALAANINCPFPIGDMDCSGGLTPIDVTILVNYVYKQLDSMCYGCGK